MQMCVMRGEDYSSAVSFLRFHFDLLMTCVVAMRRYKKRITTAVKIDNLDLDLGIIDSSC